MVVTNTKSVQREVKRETRSGFQPAELSDNARVVLAKRYLLKSAEGTPIETPDGLFKRVAKALASVESTYGATKEQTAQVEQEFYEMMASLDFLPNSPTLMNAGTGAGTLSACFVLPLTDSMEGIMKACHDAAMVQKYGGGTGFSLSEIRPADSPIATTHGKACGPIATLKLLSAVSSLVTQGGKRDGANMAVMSVHHPDILQFIDCKAQEGDIHNFNISVGVTDEFMKAVESGGTYALRHKSVPKDPSSKEVEVDRLDAREVFTKIVDGAWRNGEPGMIFLDEVNRDSPVIHIGEITATNPCGEQPLLPNESCNLGSINVGNFVVERDNTVTIDWDRLEGTVRKSIRFLDNVIDANKYAIPEIEASTVLTRKLGLGVMGFADLLIKMNIPYDSDEGVSLGKDLMKFFDKVSLEESKALAEERGPFEGWKGSKFEEQGLKIRNACRLTVAPTGTISMIAGASSGIEPLFSLAFRKQNILGGETLFYVNEEFENIAKERGFYNEEDSDLLEFLSDGGSLQEREEVPDDIKMLFRVSPDIAPEYHVRMQAAFQESTDAGISKTINFPNEATVDDVRNAYMLAWQTKCKGITVYRAGSRVKEVLTKGHKENEDKLQPVLLDDGQNGVSVVPRERPSTLVGKTYGMRTGRGKLYITLNWDQDGQPMEVFTSHGKAGGNDAAMAEAVSRLISLCFRCGIAPSDVVSQLRHITDEPVWDAGVQVRSVPDAIAIAIERAMNEVSVGQGLVSQQPKMALNENSHPTSNTTACPDCAGPLSHEEGCLKCHSCGYSKC